MRAIPVIVAGLCLLLIPVPALADAPGADDEKAELRAQIDQMQRQLVRMQQQLDQLESEQRATGEVADDERVDELESRLAAVEDDDSGDGINVGGAVRLNYGWQDYSAQNKDRLGDFELELFRINFSGSIGNVILDAEWRRYNDFQAIHHAWVGYDFSDELQMQLGISRVPFGILPYTSHSFWFTGMYYMGYEDDYDTGIQFIHRPSDDWTFHYAFFKNPEYANDSRADRYSFDLVTDGDQANTETNQFNFRLERHLALAGDSRMDLGVSLQAGQIYNRITERNGQRWAAAAHMDYYNGPWNLRLQAMRYEYDPENPEGVSTDFIQKAGFGFPFLMASEANVYSYSLSRAFDVDWGPISDVRCYNEGTWLDPQVSNSSESIQSVTGCSVAAGGLFTYFDWIAGKNMWFAGGDGIGLDGTSAGRWRSRLNINIGYYF